MRAMIRRLAAALVLAVACGSQGGCVTAAMWDTAGKPTVDEQVVTGFLVRPDGRPTAAVVEYALHSAFRGSVTHRLYAVVPFDPNGRPAAPFDYRGAATTPDAVVADVGGPQRAAIAAALDLKAGREADAVLKSPAFRPVDPFEGAARTRAGRAGVRIRYRHAAGASAGEPGGGYALYEVRVDGPPFATGAKADPAEAIAADAGLLVLPREAARPPRDRSAARTQAALLTPLTVPLDVALVALTPVWVLLSVATGGWC